MAAAACLAGTDVGRRGRFTADVEDLGTVLGGIPNCAIAD